MKALSVAVVLAFLLAGCGGEEFSDLKAELKDKTKDMRGRIAPLPVVKPYEPVPYKVFEQPDPFSAAKIELLTKSAGSGGGGLKPDFNRPKEPLEAYPLESLTMVGVLQQKKFFVTPYGRGLWLSIWADTRLDWRLIAASATIG